MIFFSCTKRFRDNLMMETYFCKILQNRWKSSKILSKYEKYRKLASFYETFEKISDAITSLLIPCAATHYKPLPIGLRFSEQFPGFYCMGPLMRHERPFNMPRRRRQGCNGVSTTNPHFYSNYSGPCFLFPTFAQF